MADALASGASGSNIVWVQVPFPALFKPRSFDLGFCYGDEEDGAHACMRRHLTTANQV